MTNISRRVFLGFLSACCFLAQRRGRCAGLDHYHVARMRANESLQAGAGTVGSKDVEARRHDHDRLPGWLVVPRARESATETDVRRCVRSVDDACRNVGWTSMKVIQLRPVLTLPEVASYACQALHRAVIHPIFDPETRTEKVIALGPLSTGDIHPGQIKTAGMELCEWADLFHVTRVKHSPGDHERAAIFLRENLSAAVWLLHRALALKNGTRFVALPLDGVGPPAYEIRDPVLCIALRVHLEKDVLCLAAAAVDEEASAAA